MDITDIKQKYCISEKLEELKNNFTEITDKEILDKLSEIFNLSKLQDTHLQEYTDDLDNKMYDLQNQLADNNIMHKNLQCCGNCYHRQIKKTKSKSILNNSTELCLINNSGLKSSQICIHWIFDNINNIDRYK